MNKSLIKNYEEVINRIKNDEKTDTILLVGSSKNKNFEVDDIEDIDIFVLSNIEEGQIRDLIEIDNLVFDINYFSKQEILRLIEMREYFFIKEMKNPSIIFNKDKDIEKIINLCKEIYEKGPKKISESEKELLLSNIKDKIDSIKNVSKSREINFLTNLYLKDIIIGYFIINNKWIPKDKKIFKTLEKENNNLYRLILDENTKTSHEYLIDIYNYLFKI